MKKVIGLTLAALLITGIVGGGTWAYFSDIETSQNNTLTAGTLDLQVGATDPCSESINIGTQIQPGDSGNAADWTATNLGNVSGTLRVTISAITNNENSWSEPEQAAGDATAAQAILVNLLAVGKDIERGAVEVVRTANLNGGPASHRCRRR